MGRNEGSRADGARIRTTARDAFGFDRLRPGQEEAIAAALEGRDVLAVMPTGLGKSAIYQVAGLLIEGLTLVVSPLLALQRDQVDSLRERDAEVGEAAALNSTLSAAEREDLLARAERGEVEFLFLAPEQLGSADTLERLEALAPSLVVVDEAHCVVEWGHDFRPDYLGIGPVIERLGHPTVVALTATAAAPVRDEVVERLGMREPAVIVNGFDRPNLRLCVEMVTGAERKLARLLEHLPELGTPGIVYVATRAHADEVAQGLRDAGHRAEAYHAGRATPEREAVQTAFMDDELDVVVATTAFGMGIDKERVRFVVHFDVPGSLDDYAQQIGRAGRDGARADALLLYDPDDVPLQRFLRAGPSVEADVHERVAALVTRSDEPLDVDEVREAVDLSTTRLQTVLHQLADVGVLEVAADGTVRPQPDAPEPVEAAAAAQRLQERHKAFERSRVAMMKDYVEATTCRRAVLLSYFGEPFEPPCGNCDRCLEGAAPVEAEGPFEPGSSVVHDRFGAGQVVRYEEGKIVVLFEDIGYQTLALDLVLDEGLLGAADQETDSA